jgi:hypothetical protein
VSPGTLIELRNFALVTNSTTPLAYALPLPGGRVDAPFVMFVSAQLTPQAVLVISPQGFNSPWVRLTGDTSMTTPFMPVAGFDVSFSDPTHSGYVFFAYLQSRDGTAAEAVDLNVTFVPLTDAGYLDEYGGNLNNTGYQRLNFVSDAGTAPGLLLAQVSLKALANAGGVAARVLQDTTVMGRDAGDASAFLVSGQREAQFFFAAAIPASSTASTFTLEATPLNPTGAAPYATFEVSRIAMLPYGIIAGITAARYQPEAVPLSAMPILFNTPNLVIPGAKYFGLVYAMGAFQGGALDFAATIGGQQEAGAFSLLPPDTCPWMSFNGTYADGGSVPLGLTVDTAQYGEVWSQTQVLLGPFDGGISVDGVAVILDGGSPDAGAPDAGVRDAGPPIIDAGSPDAGAMDAGSRDAGAPDGGLENFNFQTCGCSTGAGPLLLLAAAVLRRRRNWHWPIARA